MNRRTVRWRYERPASRSALRLQPVVQARSDIGRTRLWHPASLYLLHPCSHREAVRQSGGQILAG